MRFVITGTGRSGTGFLSKLFTALGYPCGHEAVFTPKRIKIGHPGLIGDSSWLAAPKLATFEGSVIHVVRHPMLVAMTTIRWLDESATNHRRDTFYPYLQQYVDLTGDPYIDMLRYWVDWNHRIEPYAHIRLHIDRMTAQDVHDAISLFDAAPPIPSIQHTLDNAPFQWRNHRPGIGVTWDQFPDGKLKDEAMSLALAYGYEVDPIDEWVPLAK